MAIYQLGEHAPDIDGSAYVADEATLIGKVSLLPNSSVWSGATIRGDNERITIGDGALIGIQAVILNGARIGKGCLVGAGALVTEGKEFPDNSLIIGAPAKAVRTLGPDDSARLQASAASYVARAQLFKTALKKIG